mmetsp:Transcript_18151/g.29456  ORF Transcript_18151/g.29456 Transcript_18151/m.29456 type:complete len:304 (+) Transcript_18151:119-1030(+)|eukprot:CAMPEP_0203758158 /NCGR_PEP_ID=MMETSP0098-20131031/10908_1 /ASSEMBLY_ACC=CAM_ASM_000208 /TAXON_ID=96639 /ORGANISM=" , Strain NY0313808BC1" /LENGTH=303 /DNA_ID=CAMNT_0050650439 /DNA_START=158 /DNA_END=1069 /DNA_ORIENTATION=+
MTGTKRLVIQVPKNLHGKVIGRGRATINDIESDYPGVKVIMPRRDEDTEDVVLEGPPDAVKRAHNRILDICNMAPDHSGGARKKAQALYDQADELFDRSKKASSRDEKQRLKQMAFDKKAEAEKEQKIAAKKIFAAKNDGYGRDQMDLHGLYVQEAVDFVEERLRQVDSDLRSGNLESLTIITGAGHHSDSNGPKIKPKVVALLREKGYPFEEDPAGGQFVVAFETPTKAGVAPPKAPEPVTMGGEQRPMEPTQQGSQEEDASFTALCCKFLCSLFCSTPDDKNKQKPAGQSREQEMHHVAQT